MSDYMYSVSEALSEVLNDIGVNERFVMRRRRAFMLKETTDNISPDYVAISHLNYFGSQSEGSTTLGLKSDMDALFSFNFMNVIQSMSEWQHGVKSGMMIQNENISPGYCYLQYIRADIPSPATIDVVNSTIALRSVTDSEGRLLLKNHPWCTPATYQKHGPALTAPGGPGYYECDRVESFYCASFPYQAFSRLQNQRQGKWPTEDVLEDCRNAGCFVVLVGSKVHSPDMLEYKLEWRISTSLQERYLMFSLNIPQLMCYILMKMILKTHIHPHVEGVLSSFMCKNVLLYCIANSSHDWSTGSLLSYLHLCLFMLKECIDQRNCPHFLIPENNLLAAHMTDTQRGKLLDIVDNLMKNDEQLLFEIQFDDLGRRLKMKLNIIPYSASILSPTDIALRISCEIVSCITAAQYVYIEQVLNGIKHDSFEMANLILSETYSTLESYGHEGDLHHAVMELLKPHLSSTMGSVIASANIDTQATISDQAYAYLEAGKESDALSGGLKFASVLYCTGQIERAECELTINMFDSFNTICHCYRKCKLPPKFGDTNPYDNDNEKAIMSTVAFCTRFLQCEINCVPHELRYEILKSYNEEDRKMRTDEDSKWMDFIVVDSIPYLYFLQYKTYGLLHRRKEQVKALKNLAKSVDFTPNLRHWETDANLLGQCLEQENLQTDAFYGYIASLELRKRNNAARFLLCIQLCKLRKRVKTNTNCPVVSND